jgi:TolB-like protein/AraC-like DNA-binding protein
MTHSDKTLVEKLDIFLDKNLENPSLSVDDICLEMGVSRSQLHRILIEKTQLSTTLYIRKKRLEKAKNLLSTTNLRISEITDAVGINNHANFSKYFIEEFNVSPTDFRKRTPELIEVSDEESLPSFEDIVLHDNQPDNYVITKPKSYRRWYLLLGLVVLSSMGFYFFSKALQNNITQFDDGLNQISESSLAILPFKNLGSPDNAMFCDGVMEQIHGSLSLLENLKVISKTSSMVFRNTKKPIGQIANELHVKYILEGSVLQIDKKIRITIGLTDAKEDRSVWTKSYDGDTKDVLP